MDLNAVQMFVFVVQAGSLTAAAERLNIPLPTLSRRVRQLEAQLKIQLLERSARGAKLTEAGIRFYEHASRGVEIFSEGREAVLSDQAKIKGRLRLSLPTAFEPWWQLLSEFQQRFPDVRLNVYTTERRVDPIEDGIDVAVRVGAIVHESMIARRLLSYRHVLVASPLLLKQLGRPKTPADLTRFPCAVWGVGDSSAAKWTLGSHAIEPTPVLATNDYSHLRNFAVAGGGVAELPPYLAASDIARGKLVALLSAHPLPEHHVNLLYPSHRHPSAIVRAYLEFCQARVAWFAELCRIPAARPSSRSDRTRRGVGSLSYEAEACARGGPC